MREPKVDRVIFGSVLFVVLASCIPLALMPERGARFVSDLYDAISHDFGVLYQWAGIGAIVAHRRIRGFDHDGWIPPAWRWAYGGLEWLWVEERQ